MVGEELEVRSVMLLTHGPLMDLSSEGQHVKIGHLLRVPPLGILCPLNMWSRFVSCCYRDLISISGASGKGMCFKCTYL